MPHCIPASWDSVENFHAILISSPLNVTFSFFLQETLKIFSLSLVFWMLWRCALVLVFLGLLCWAPAGPFRYENVSSRPGKIFLLSFSFIPIFQMSHLCFLFVFLFCSIIWAIPSNPSGRPMSSHLVGLLALPAFKASPVQLCFLLPSAWTSCAWEFGLLNFSLSLFPRFAPSAWSPSSSNPLSDPTPPSRLSSQTCSLKLFHPCLRLFRLLQQSTIDWV